MIHHRKILIAGASGLVGTAALNHFASLKDWDVVGVSRRPNRNSNLESHVALLAVDLEDRDSCVEVFSGMHDVTHVIYTAVRESTDLLDGWSGRDDEHTRRNLIMLRNLFEPLESVATELKHISILQGTKAYGAHLGIPLRVPLRERHPRVEHKNFYFVQQDYLEEQSSGKDWSFTIWRPQTVFGDALGTPLSVLPAIGVYAALLRERDEPLYFPGNPDWWEVHEAIDSEMLARAFSWATGSAIARNEVYNITNGDQMVWQDIWPTIADAFGMEVGGNRPMLLASLPSREHEWIEIVDKYGLRGPRRLSELVGQGFTFADNSFGHGKGTGCQVTISATTKLRQHGFHETVDTEEMFRKYFDQLQRAGIFPGPNFLSE